MFEPLYRVHKLSLFVHVICLVVIPKDMKPNTCSVMSVLKLCCVAPPRDQSENYRTLWKLFHGVKSVSITDVTFKPLIIYKDKNNQNVNPQTVFTL